MISIAMPMASKSFDKQKDEDTLRQPNLVLQGLLNDHSISPTVLSKAARRETFIAVGWRTASEGPTVISYRAKALADFCLTLRQFVCSMRYSPVAVAPQ
jgi:hypothetical protein